MLNAIKCIDQRFKFKFLVFFLSGLHIQLEKSEYDSPVCKKNQLQVVKYYESCTFFSLSLIRTNGLVVKTGCKE